MAKRTGDGPAKGHNRTADEEAAKIRKAFKILKGIDDEKLKMAADWSARRKTATGVLKELGHKVKHCLPAYENWLEETRADTDEELQEVTEDQAIAIDTMNICHAAMHDGKQLDLFKMGRVADKARKTRAAAAEKARTTEDSEEDAPSDAENSEPAAVH